MKWRGARLVALACACAYLLTAFNIGTVHFKGTTEGTTTVLAHPVVSRAREARLQRKTTLGVVVSVCKEPPQTFEQLVLFMNRLVDDGFDVRRHVYCKCGPWEACDRYVQNIGREGETFARHIAENYDTLDDVIWFVNGGFLSKKHAKVAVRRHMHVFTSSGDLFHGENSKAQRVYLDDWLTSFEKISRRDQTNNKSDARIQNCIDDASRHCASVYRCEYTLPCARNQACACEIQRDCQWIGATKSNYWNDTHHDYALDVPLPDHMFPKGYSFYTWACVHLNVHASLLHRCGASRSGIFAVGASRVRAYPVSVYESLVDEYANYGTNGGIVSHYVERLYRGLFFCALSDTNRATHFLKVFFLHSKRALIWKFGH